MNRVGCIVVIYLVICGTLNSQLLFAADSGTLFLNIAEESTTLSKVIRTVKTLRSRFPDSTVVASKDCTNLSSGQFFAVVGVYRDKPRQESNQPNGQPHRLHLQKCSPNKDGLLAFGIPLVDPSIEQLPSNVVNWSDSDKISSLANLSGARLWFRRIYVESPEDVREGRRTSVLLFEDSPGQNFLLSSDCSDGVFSAFGGKIALSCARETVADNLLHEVKVFDIASKKEIASIQRCRNPTISSPSFLTCQAETVDKDGHLILQKKSLILQ
jgi:hypothetical protein